MILRSPSRPFGWICGCSPVPPVRLSLEVHSPDSEALPPTQCWSLPTFLGDTRKFPKTQLLRADLACVLGVP